jgi:hypothetical protein
MSDAHILLMWELGLLTCVGVAFYYLPERVLENHGEDRENSNSLHPPRPLLLIFFATTGTIGKSSEITMSLSFTAEARISLPARKMSIRSKNDGKMHQRL